MIDQKVDEKWAKFQAEYDEVMNKMKKSMVGMMVKPGGGLPGLGLGRKEAQSESVKGRTNTDDDSTPGSRPSTALKRPMGGGKVIAGSK